MYFPFICNVRMQIMYLRFYESTICLQFTKIDVHEKKYVHNIPCFEVVHVFKEVALYVQLSLFIYVLFEKKNQNGSDLS